MTAQAPRFYDFSPFRLDLLEHLLLRDGKAVPLTPKAFDTLLVLVRNSGHIVEKAKLLKSVWPETFVEEATLAQNIFTVRKALGGSEGEQYVQTIPKRGYRFVARVTQVMDGSANVSVDQFEAVTHNVRHHEAITRGNILAVYVGGYALDSAGVPGYFGSWAVLMTLVFISLAVIQRHVPRSTAVVAGH